MITAIFLNAAVLSSNPFARLIGTWTGSSVVYATPFSRRGHGHSTIVCAAPGGSLSSVVCDARGAGAETVDVYIAGLAPRQYWYGEIGASSQPFRERLVIDGSRWTYLGGYSEGGKRIFFRTINIFTPGRERFEAAYSDDAKRTWHLISRGVAVRDPVDSALAAASREMDAFSRGDRARFAAQFAPDAVIVDDVAPFRYAGSSAATDWFTQNRPYLRDVSIVGGTPLEARSSTDGSRVYLAMPITISGHGMKGRAFTVRVLWTGTFARDTSGAMRIKSLTISPIVLSVDSCTTAGEGRY